MGTAVVTPQSEAYWSSQPPQSAGPSPDDESYWSAKQDTEVTSKASDHQDEKYWSIDMSRVAGAMPGTPSPAQAAPRVPVPTELQGQSPAQTTSRPIAEISAYQPTWLDKARTAVANSVVGHSLESAAPGVADALNLHPSETFGSQESKQDAASLPNVAPLLPSWATQPVLPKVRNASEKIDSALGLNNPGSISDQNRSAVAAYDQQHPVQAGIAEGIRNTTDSLSSPVNATMMTAAPESEILSGIFAAQAAKGSYDSAKSALEAYKAGNNKEAAQMATEAIASGAVAGLAGSHALRGGTPVPHAGEPLPTEPNGVWYPREPRRLANGGPSTIEGEVVPPKPAESPSAKEAPTHSAGKVVGYDAKDGLPIIDRSEANRAAAEAALTGKPMTDVARAGHQPASPGPEAVQPRPASSSNNTGDNAPAPPSERERRDIGGQREAI